MDLNLEKRVYDNNLMKKSHNIINKMILTKTENQQGEYKNISFSIKHKENQLESYQCLLKLGLGNNMGKRIKETENILTKLLKRKIELEKLSDR